MNAADFVRDYGYYAVIVGTFFEGETVMLAAGVAASSGILQLHSVVLAGMTGIFASDTFCFLLGRLAGRRIKRWFPRLYARLNGVYGLIERHEDKLIIYYQFFPGLCTVTPVAFGLTRIPAARFLALDFLGNAFWTLIFSLGGYAFGTTFWQAMRGAHDWQLLAGALLLPIPLAAWWISRAVFKRLSRPAC
jgi:membrane protein DedA with SNARE-associated domain